MATIQETPQDAIRGYLHANGGETDATVDHLLVSFGMDENDADGRRQISLALAAAGVESDRALEGLGRDETVRLSLAEEPTQVMATPGSQPQPGWYGDPATPHAERWWDGVAWTGEARPFAPAGPPPPAPPHNPRRPWYKGWWVSGLAVLLLLAAAAGVYLFLSSDRHENSNAQTRQAKAGSAHSVKASSGAPVKHEPAQVGDSLTVRASDTTLKVRVTGVLDPLSVGEFDSPDGGNRFVGVRVVLQNTGANTYSDAVSNGSTLVLEGDEQADSTIVSGGPCESGFGSDVKIAPGDTRAGCIPFEVPSASGLRTFQFTADSGFADDTGEWDLSSASPSTSGAGTTDPSSGSVSDPTTGLEPDSGTAGFRACDQNISAKIGTTTCPFAENAFYEYWNSDGSDSISVYSPATGKTYATSCASSSGEITCRTDDDGEIRFSQSAVDGYSQEQADHYAATHKLSG